VTLNAVVVPLRARGIETMESKESKAGRLGFFERFRLPKPIWAVWMVVLGVRVTLGAKDFNFNTEAVEGTLKSFGIDAFGKVSGIMSVGCFLVVFWMFIEGYMNKQLAQKWFAIMGVAIFGILLALFPTLFGTLTGVSVK